MFEASEQKVLNYLIKYFFMTTGCSEIDTFDFSQQNSSKSSQT